VLTIDQAREVIGATAYSSDGDKIGRIGQLYLDDATEQPEWVTVSTGLFGTKESFVPLAEAQVEGDRVTVPYTKDQVKGAPRIDVHNGHLSEREESDLYRHYGLPESGPFTTGSVPGDTGYVAGTSGTVQTGTPGYAGTDADAPGYAGTGADAPGYAGTGADAPGYADTSADVREVRTDSAAEQAAADAAPTEEQLRAGVEDRRTGRSRLRRYESGDSDEPVR
jgi:hypothetical protein